MQINDLYNLFISGPPSKAAIKLKKKREAKKAKKANEVDSVSPSKESTAKENSHINKSTTGDIEVDKKIKNIMKVFFIKKYILVYIIMKNSFNLEIGFY